MKIILLALLSTSTIINVKGVVEISPSGVTAVCQEGDELELICNTSGIAHRWEFTVFPENMTYTTVPVQSLGTSGVPALPLTISTSVITISRLSGQNILPLVSRVVVSPVSSDLNGTVVNCFEGGLSSTTLVATTTIQIIVDPDKFGLSIRSNPEQFSSDGVTVIMEWTLLNSQIYYQQFLRNVSISTYPPINNVMFIGSMRFQLVLSYNTLYNVSVTQHSTCERLIRTAYLHDQLNYIKCTNPMELTSALVMGYVDPALEGQNITFTCAPEQVLNGSNISTCIGNGKWEPDLGEVECIGKAIATTTGTGITLQPTDCLPQNACFRPRTATATTCTVGQPTGTTMLGTPNLDISASLRPVLISVSSLLIVASVLMFIVGLSCGCCLSQRWRKLIQHKRSATTSHTIEQVEDLELKENVAYVTLRPK